MDREIQADFKGKFFDQAKLKVDEIETNSRLNSDNL